MFPVEKVRVADFTRFGMGVRILLDRNERVAWLIKGFVNVLLMAEENVSVADDVLVIVVVSIMPERNERIAELVMESTF